MNRDTLAIYDRIALYCLVALWLHAKGYWALDAEQQTFLLDELKNWLKQRERFAPQM